MLILQTLIRQNILTSFFGGCKNKEELLPLIKILFAIHLSHFLLLSLYINENKCNFVCACSMLKKSIHSTQAFKVYNYCTVVIIIILSKCIFYSNNNNKDEFSFLPA